MFEIFDENMLTLKEGRSLFRHGHRTPNLRTIRRWCKPGLFNRRTQKRVRLQSVLDGGTLYTSQEAIQRFRAALNQDSLPWG